MSEIPIVDLESLDLKDTPRIEWVTVKDALNLLWEKNPKLHDIGSIVESILEHGWQELPKFDATLKAIKAGNGRIEAIHFMERDEIAPEGLPCPRGVALTLSGDWAIPILFGVDAPSVEVAEAYAVDSNNLTMTGGDFTAVDMLQMWDSTRYLELLKGLRDSDIFPVSVDSDTLDTLLAFSHLADEIEFPEAEGGEPEGESKDVIQIEVMDFSQLEPLLSDVREMVEGNNYNAVVYVK